MKKKCYYYLVTIHLVKVMQTSRRIAVLVTTERNSVEKTMVFKHVRFRVYP